MDRVAIAVAAKLTGRFVSFVPYDFDEAEFLREDELTYYDNNYYGRYRLRQFICKMCERPYGKHIYNGPGVQPVCHDQAELIERILTEAK